MSDERRIAGIKRVASQNTVCETPQCYEWATWCMTFEPTHPRIAQLYLCAEHKNETVRNYGGTIRG